MFLLPLFAKFNGRRGRGLIICNRLDFALRACPVVELRSLRDYAPEDFLKKTLCIF